MLSREEELNEIVNLDFERIVYIGSGSLAGLTREAQLKILELTAGKVATILTLLWASVMDQNHLLMKTIMFGFVNNTPYTRDYDLDILEEVHGDEIAAGVLRLLNLANVISQVQLLNIPQKLLYYLMAI